MQTRGHGAVSLGQRERVVLHQVLAHPDTRLSKAGTFGPSKHGHNSDPVAGLILLDYGHQSYQVPGVLMPQGALPITANVLVRAFVANPISKACIHLRGCD